MSKKTDVEMERMALAKIARTALRLKHSLAADREINDTLPDTLNEFDARTILGDLAGAKNLFVGLIGGISHEA